LPYRRGYSLSIVVSKQRSTLGSDPEPSVESCIVL